MAESEALAQSVTAANVQLTEQRKKAVESQETAEQAGKAERWERYRSNIAAAAAALQLQHSDSAGGLSSGAAGAPRLGVAAPAQAARRRPRRDARRHAGLGYSRGNARLSVLRANGRRLVVGLDRQVCEYDATTGRQLPVLGSHEHRIQRMVISLDGKRILSLGEQEHTLHLWDGVTGREVAALSGHTDSPAALSFSPDGRRVVTASADRTLRIWDTVSPSVRARTPDIRKQPHE